MSATNKVFGSVLGFAVLVVYIFAAALLFMAGWYGLKLALPGPGIHLALYVILFILIAALLGAWLWVLVSLPQGLSARFDPIKNRIAAGEITSSKMFSEELAAFIASYFSFFRFDVNCVIVQVKNHDPYRFPEDNSMPYPEIRQLAEQSRSTRDLIPLGRQKCSGQNYYGYLVPIWFGGDWLGYFCVFTDTRLMKLFQQVLKEFEEQYVDDQLVHVLHFEKRTGKFKNPSEGQEGK